MTFRSFYHAPDDRSAIFPIRELHNSAKHLNGAVNGFPALFPRWALSTAGGVSAELDVAMMCGGDHRASRDACESGDFGYRYAVPDGDNKETGAEQQQTFRLVVFAAVRIQKIAGSEGQRRTQKQILHRLGNTSDKPGEG
jgi:hypothetical protein